MDPNCILISKVKKTFRNELRTESGQAYLTQLKDLRRKYHREGRLLEFRLDESSLDEVDVFQRFASLKDKLAFISDYQALSKRMNSIEHSFMIRHIGADVPNT